MDHAVIMAGGAGTRLWPLSRQARPKHFLKLFGGRSLLRHAFERLSDFLPAERIWIITSAGHLDLVAGELPEVPVANLIGEPAVRDTANAVGLAAVLLRQRDPAAVMGVFTADHIITPQDRFEAALRTTYRAAATHPEHLFTIGITPRSAHTGYGYVRRGEPLTSGVYRVREFKEKPDAVTAQHYLESGDYYWNSGMFVWTVDTVLAEFAAHLPENHALLQEVAGDGGQSAAARQSTIARIYPQLPKISIDYGVMERAARVAVCEMDCTWLDVGAWTALPEILGSDADGLVRAHPAIAALDSRNTIIVGEDDHLIATIGVQDLVIVRSKHATLVCHKDHVQRIKDLVGQLDEVWL